LLPVVVVIACWLVAVAQFDYGYWLLVVDCLPFDYTVWLGCYGCYGLRLHTLRLLIVDPLRWLPRWLVAVYVTFTLLRYRTFALRLVALLRAFVFAFALPHVALLLPVVVTLRYVARLLLRLVYIYVTFVLHALHVVYGYVVGCCYVCLVWFTGCCYVTLPFGCRWLVGC